MKFAVSSTLRFSIEAPNPVIARALLDGWVDQRRGEWEMSSIENLDCKGKVNMLGRARVSIKEDKG